VRAFELGILQERDLLYIGDPTDVSAERPLEGRAALAVSPEFVVLSHGKALIFWSRVLPSPDVPGWGWSGDVDGRVPGAGYSPAGSR
jgi:hypothetical protein